MGNTVLIMREWNIRWLEYYVRGMGRYIDSIET